LGLAAELFDSPAQLLDTICVFLDPAGQLAHLGFEPIHAKLGIDGRVAARRVNRNRTTATVIDMPLQHVQIAFEPIEPLVWRAFLRP
jgi:hypothetical protein